VLEQAPKPLRVGAGDKLFAYVYLSPEKPPKEIMLQWHSTNWLHRAYWGENAIPWGADNTPERRPQGKLPKAGEGVRIEVDAAQVGLKPGAVITGWAFTHQGGVSYWDRAGLHTLTPQADQPFDTLSAWVRLQRSLGGTGLPPDVQALVKLDRDKRTPEQQKQLLAYFIEHAYSKARPILAPLTQQLAAIDKEREALDKQMPATYVFREMKTPKPSYILKRGEYDQRGPQVERATPAFLPP